MAGFVHRCWCRLKHHIQEWDQVGARLLQVKRCGASTRIGVDDREVDLLLIRTKVKEELIDLVNDLLDACVGAIDLVDHKDHRERTCKRLGEDVARLWEGPFRRVNQKEYGVNGQEAALNLATEIGVAWCINDYDAHTLELDRRLLGEDGDPLLALKVAAIHHALHELFVRAEGTVLAQQAIHQRGLPVVNVRNDADGANARLGNEVCGSV